ncbi:hypothetical protein ASG52_24745 [Methylobacterium sp. Leaf456]|nr:hypothetical protein ASG52_24745 [Methylobacterium sp. Leaf456]
MPFSTDREAELRSLINFAEGLGLRETTARAIYEAVEANDRIALSVRHAEVRRQLLMVTRKP